MWPAGPHGGPHPAYTVPAGYNVPSACSYGQALAPGGAAAASSGHSIHGQLHASARSHQAAAQYAQPHFHPHSTPTAGGWRTTGAYETGGRAAGVSAPASAPAPTYGTSLPAHLQDTSVGADAAPDMPPSPLREPSVEPRTAASRCAPPQRPAPSPRGSRQPPRRKRPRPRASDDRDRVTPSTPSPPPPAPPASSTAKGVGDNAAPAPPAGPRSPGASADVAAKGDGPEVEGVLAQLSDSNLAAVGSSELCKWLLVLGTRGTPARRAALARRAEPVLAEVHRRVDGLSGQLCARALSSVARLRVRSPALQRDLCCRAHATAGSLSARDISHFLAACARLQTLYLPATDAGGEESWAASGDGPVSADEGGEEEEAEEEEEEEEDFGDSDSDSDNGVGPCAGAQDQGDTHASGPAQGVLLRVRPRHDAGNAESGAAAPAAGPEEGEVEDELTILLRSGASRGLGGEWEQHSAAEGSVPGGESRPHSALCLLDASGTEWRNVAGGSRRPTAHRRHDDAFARRLRGQLGRVKLRDASEVASAYAAMGLRPTTLLVALAHRIVRAAAEEEREGKEREEGSGEAVALSSHRPAADIGALLAAYRGLTVAPPDFVVTALRLYLRATSPSHGHSAKCALPGLASVLFAVVGVSRHPQLPLTALCRAVEAWAPTASAKAAALMLWACAPLGSAAPVQRAVQCARDRLAERGVAEECPPPFAARATWALGQRCRGDGAIARRLAPAVRRSTPTLGLGLLMYAMAGQASLGAVDERMFAAAERRVLPGFHRLPTPRLAAFLLALSRAGRVSPPTLRALCEEAARPGFTCSAFDACALLWVLARGHGGEGDADPRAVDALATAVSSTAGRQPRLDFACSAIWALGRLRQHRPAAVAVLADSVLRRCRPLAAEWGVAEVDPLPGAGDAAPGADGRQGDDGGEEGIEWGEGGASGPKLGEGLVTSLCNALWAMGATGLCPSRARRLAWVAAEALCRYKEEEAEAQPARLALGACIVLWCAAALDLRDAALARRAMGVLSARPVASFLLRRLREGESAEAAEGGATAVDAEAAETVDGRKLLSMLFQAHLFLRLEWTGHGVALPADVVSGSSRHWHRMKRDVRTSQTQRDVARALRRMGLEAREEVMEASYSLDVVLEGVRDRRGRRVAVEVDGPFHYFANYSAAEMNNTALKARQLAATGWCVVSVRATDFNAARDDAGRVAFLRSVLAAAGADLPASGARNS